MGNKSMSQPDTILRTTGNEREIWYSNNYLLQQIGLAFHAGISAGIKVEFHAVQPISGDMVDDYTNEFWLRVNEQYKEKFEKGHVWAIAGKSSIDKK
jgi:hypothetical protein